MGWDHPIQSESHPHVRQDLCIFSDLLTLLNIEPINLLLLLVKMVLFYKYFYSTVRQEIPDTATITEGNRPAIHTVTCSKHFSQESLKTCLHENFVRV